MPTPSTILEAVVQSFGRRMRFHRRDAETHRADRSHSGSAGEAVILPFGRYFAACADLLTREGLKTVAPIDGVSPFTAVDDPDPDMLPFAESARTTDRARADVLKDFPSRLEQSGADYLVVDNSSALIRHRELNGRLYMLIASEDTNLMDALCRRDAEQARRLGFKISAEGFTDRLRERYDAFVGACLANFHPSKIVLIRSYGWRFWVAEDGVVAPTNVNQNDAGLLKCLDDYFIERTGCRVSDAVLRCVPRTANWVAYDHSRRMAIEADLVSLLTSPLSGECDREGACHLGGRVQDPAAADHVVDAVRRNHAVDKNLIRSYFAGDRVSYDDLLALAFLRQAKPGVYGALIRTCVRRAVAYAKSYPSTETRRHFDRSLRALRNWDWRSVKLPKRNPWIPQITVACGPVVFRYHRDGSIEKVLTSKVAASDADAVVDGSIPITPLNLTDVIASWSIYFERGRRGIATALRAVVPDSDALVDSCYWLDWSWVLDNEHVVITTPGDPDPSGPKVPGAKTDLSFIFDSNVRICTVGGGLMDQVTHVALFDGLCTPHGLDYYLDDFRYTWGRSHNGFEASRLAPDLERKRMTRQVSQALIESFRHEVTKVALPWAYAHARTWYDFGLREAVVVTLDHVHARRLMEIGPDFRLIVYSEPERLGELIRVPPGPVGIFATLQRIPIEAKSADVLRQIFSYHHLRLDPDVASTAELLRAEPHVAIHVRRGDYLSSAFDPGGRRSRPDLYRDAISHLIESEFGTSAFNVAVFSDDLGFVEAHASDYGLDRVTGGVRFIRGNSGHKSIFDSYLMSLCPVIVGSVGSFAATTSLLADPPSVFIRARPEGVSVEWRR